MQKGGGAKSFNFSALSQDLLAVTLEIPFSVPPYMSLIARSIVTLEGLALMGDENYQMVAQAYPFVVRKVLRNEDTGASSLLRSIVYDSAGNIKPTRMNALLNAALGFVSDKKEGFIDFDAVPEDGASVKVSSTQLSMSVNTGRDVHTHHEWLVSLPVHCPSRAPGVCLCQCSRVMAFDARLPVLSSSRAALLAPPGCDKKKAGEGRMP